MADSIQTYFLGILSLIKVLRSNNDQFANFIKQTEYRLGIDPDYHESPGRKYSTNIPNTEVQLLIKYLFGLYFSQLNDVYYFQDLQPSLSDGRWLFDSSFKGPEIYGQTFT